MFASPEFSTHIAHQLRELEPCFTYEHLPPHLQEISRPYCELAQRHLHEYMPNSQTVEALRLLVQAKDAAVRAHVIRESL